VKLDAVTSGGPLAAVFDEVRAAEARRYDGWSVSEVATTPSSPVLVDDLRA
jgi:hypothetical protein